MLLLRFRFDEKVLPRYVFAFAQTPYYREWVSAIQRSAGQPNINAQEYRSLELPLPPLPEQRKIVAELDAAYAAKRAADEKAAMAQLFGCTTENVLMHLKNIYADGELQDNATTKDFLVVRFEGARQVPRQIKHYNLDAIIAVGYRVNSARATQFRIWATKVLREHSIKKWH